MVRLFIICDFDEIHLLGGALSCYMFNCSSYPKKSNKKPRTMLGLLR